MTPIVWGPSAEVLDSRNGMRAEEASPEAVEIAIDQDETDGIDWDDPESWYDEGGSG